MTVRAFVLTWDELTGWWERCDPAEVAAALTDEQRERFQNTVTGTIRFAEAVARVRQLRAPHRLTSAKRGRSAAFRCGDEDERGRTTPVRPLSHDHLADGISMSSR
jgi:hypothetical protein